MGYTFIKDATKETVIKNILDEYKCNIIKHTLKGNCLWAVFKNNNTSFIALFLLENDKGFGWGYKSMDESVHPYYYSCPLNYLGLVPVSCLEWREKVIQEHNKKKQSFSVGDKLILQNSSIPFVIITNIIGKKIIGQYNNKTYRIPPRFWDYVASQETT